MMAIQNRVMSLVNAGQLQTAKQECLNACNLNPENAQLWFLLSAVCGQLQDYPAAEKYSKKVLEIDDSVPSAYYNLAVAQKGQGKIDEAITSLDKAIELQDNFTAALYEQGNNYLEKQDCAYAIDYYSKVINSAPEAFQAYASMAIALQQQGEIESAVSACINSLRINPAQQDVTLRLATLYDDQGKSDEAIQYYKRAIELGYRKNDIYINIGRMFASRGDYSEAENHYKQALTIKPDAIEALTNLAVLYEETGDTTDALKHIKKAYQLNSEDERVTYNYAKILVLLHQYTQAEMMYRKVLGKNPNFVEAAVNLGNLYLLCGKVKKAYDMYSCACATKPDYLIACSNMVVSLNYSDQYSAVEVRDLHYALADRIESEASRFKKHIYSNKANKLLRIGYVSADFRDHSVAYFLNDILKYSDKTKVVNYCYSDVSNSDVVTKRLESYVDHWRDTSLLDDETLAKTIQKDKIDVLIDLSGHTSGNRLAVFALKPAPSQITYLGYPNTTGLKAMDYRIVDKNTDPDGCEKMMSESPLYIEPCFLSYTPPFKDKPKISKLPALDNGYITFGSFNNLAKISDEVIEAWSKILLATPHSKLCLKAKPYADCNIKNEYFKLFQEAGIDSERLILLSSTKTTHEHLQLYNSIDIALDTFPYNGTTTTFEALWMGVPVVCIKGERHASRVSSSVIKTLGVNELVAADQQQYVNIACDFANNLEGLAVLRDELRPRMSQSPLLDGREFTRKFESALLGVSRESSEVK